MTGCIPGYVNTSPRLRGRVCDARTKKPVTGATVKLESGRPVATKTDAKGEFTLQSKKKIGLIWLLPIDRPLRPVWLVILHKGYQPTWKDANLHYCCPLEVTLEPNTP